MRKQFDIKYRPQIESGEYQVFAHEHEEQEARIVCWDNKGEYPIVALVDNEPEKFDKYGRVPGGTRGGEFSLFIVTPEEEMSEMETLLLSWLSLDTSGRAPMEWMKQEVKARATKLLALAREELFANDAVLKEYAEVAREQGKADALKDLPRWKKAIGYIPQLCLRHESNTGNYTLDMAQSGDMYIPIIDLINLPKEDESHE